LQTEPLRGVLVRLWRPALLAIWLVAQPAGAQFQQGAVSTFGEVIPHGGTPADLVLDETRGVIYFVNGNANRVDVYNYLEKRFTGSMEVGAAPSGAALSMDSQLLYVANTGSGTLSVFDLTAGALTQTVSLPARPEGVEVGADGRVLITTQGVGPNNALNTLLIFDRTMQLGQQVVPVPSPPPLSTPAPLPLVFVGRATPFPGRLIRTPDGQLIVGMAAINQTTNNPTTTLFVYESASGTVLRNRTVPGQSTVLSMAPDGSRFMAGATLYDLATLSVIGQQSTSNLPFIVGAQGFNPAINQARNLGGSAFSPDGEIVYGAFNTAGTNLRPEAIALYFSHSRNLGVRLGIRLPESVLGRMVMTADGTDLWASSESGMMHLPLAEIYERPIIEPDTTSVFLAVDECNRGIARGAVRVNNLGKGKLTFSVPVVTTALISQLTTGVAPTTITFVMEPGRAGVARQAGTNLFTGAGGGNGAPINVTLQSREAINFPNTIRVYMNYRQPDQRGVVHAVPTTLNNNEGLQELILDEPRERVYISNSGFNRIEVFDTRRQRFVEPISVGQLPRSMAMTLDRGYLYVGNSGGESISVVDLETRKVVGEVEFPPIPRPGNQAVIRPLALGMGLSGLQFIMSNGGVWKVTGNQAAPRVVNSILAGALAGPAQYTLSSTTNGEYLVALAGNGTAYLYDALADSFTSSRQLINTPPPISYFGPSAGGPGGGYFLVNGLILSPALSVIGGSERPGVVQIGPPPAPGQPPTQTVVSSGQRNVAAVFPLNETSFVRVTTPVRQNINAQTRDDPRTTVELVDIRTGAESVAAVAPENPPFSVFGNQRIGVPARQLAVDSQGNAYVISLSGLSVIPLVGSRTTNRPAITGGTRGFVNSSDGTPVFGPGAFVTISGVNLGSAAQADQLPLPSVLGGSCVVLSDIPLPLLQTSPGQISAQIPDTLRPGLYVGQVRSLARAQSSDAVLVTVQRPQ